MKMLQVLVVSFSLFTLFAWSVCSSLNLFFIIVCVLPSLFTLYKILSNHSKKYSYFVYVYVVMCLLINVTATKNPLIFPILLNGTFSVVSHDASSTYAYILRDRTEPCGVSANDDVEKRIKYCESLQDSYDVVRLNYPYPVKITREVSHGEIILIPTVFFSIQPREYIDPPVESSKVGVAALSKDTLSYRMGTFYPNVVMTKPFLAWWVVYLNRYFDVLVCIAFVLFLFVTFGVSFDKTKKPDLS